MLPRRHACLDIVPEAPALFFHKVLRPDSCHGSEQPSFRAEVDGPQAQPEVAGAPTRTVCLPAQRQNATPICSTTVLWYGGIAWHIPGEVKLDAQLFSQFVRSFVSEICPSSTFHTLRQSETSACSNHKHTDYGLTQGTPT